MTVLVSEMEGSDVMRPQRKINEFHVNRFADGQKKREFVIFIGKRRVGGWEQEWAEPRNMSQLRKELIQGGWERNIRVKQQVFQSGAHEFVRQIWNESGIRNVRSSQLVHVPSN